MCVIIDADLAGRVFATPRQAEFVPLWHWVERKDGVIVYGGKLAGELKKVGNAWRYLRQLNAAGRAHHEPDTTVLPEEEHVAGLGICRSDDPHVIALARITRARVLCSADRNLHADFTNPQLINQPRGRVYQNAGHAHLLKHTPGCVGRRQ